MPPDRLTLPPEHLLDDETVSAAAEAWRKATEQHTAARHERVEAERAASCCSSSGCSLQLGEAGGGWLVAEGSR